MENNVLDEGRIIERISRHQIEPYQVIKSVSRRGRVSLVRGLESKQDFAMKAFLDGENEAPKFERYEHELFVQSILGWNGGHRNIRKMREFMSNGSECYIVYHPVYGRNLIELLIKERKLSPEQVLNIIPRVCDALSYTHGRGVIHRDVKLNNIFLEESESVVTPKLFDFDLAWHRLLPSFEAEKAGIIGTMGYMSPERMLLGIMDDPRMDTYSLGIVVYNLLTGAMPFKRAIDCLVKPPRDPKQFNPEITPELADVLMKALEKNPYDRYQTAGELKVDLEKAILL